jgi:hypothetical protein
LSGKHLHIVSFDVPYPPDYGGVIDVFFKIKALHAEGVSIHLHCFEYGRAEARELESLCEKVYYYKRDMSKFLLAGSLPYIVSTRHSERLMDHLLRDSCPILFEGLHSSFHLKDVRLKDRLTLVRSHNIEHDYYSNLASVEKKFLRRLYFKRESAKLRQFESVFNKARFVMAISTADEKELKTRYSNVLYVPAFHPNDKVLIRPGIGKFVLYHGNLEVGENNEAALYLVNTVFAGSTIPLVIAGKNPTAELRMAVEKHPFVQLKANIPTLEIDELIREAQVNILPTFQNTGIKLKLLAALYNGRHCIVNTPMVLNTGLEVLCSIQDTAASLRSETERLFKIPFDASEAEKRAAVLYSAFSNKQGAGTIKSLIQTA